MTITVKTQKIRPHGAYCSIADLLALRFAAQELNLFAHKPSRSLLAGNTRTRFRGRGMDFEEVRQYQPGDDIRTIDWRVTARTQIPHTKLYSEERERPVHMVCDQRASMFFGSINSFKSVVATHVTALLAWSAIQGSDRLGGFVFGNKDFQEIQPKRSKHAVLQLLHQLEIYNNQLTTPIAPSGKGLSLTEILADTKRIAKPGSAVFIISDFCDFNDAAQEQLFQLGKHLDVTLIHIYDPLEYEMKGRGTLTISDGNEQCQLPLGDVKFQQHYANSGDSRRQALKQKTQQLGMELLQISTADDAMKLLQQRFSRKRRRKAGPSNK